MAKKEGKDECGKGEALSGDRWWGEEGEWAPNKQKNVVMYTYLVISMDEV